MALTVITTPGATDANSYCSKTEADTYFQAHLYKTDWENASSSNKNIALVMATRILDEQVDWAGYIADDEQALRWPRDSVFTIDGVELDDDTIPDFLKNATAEMAMYLLASNRTADDETLGFSRIKAEGLEMVIDKTDRQEVIPDAVYQMVKNYGDMMSGAPTVEIVRT